MALQAVKGLGARRLRLLLDNFKSPKGILEASFTQLSAFLPAEVAQAILRFQDWEAVEQEWRFITDNGIAATFFTDAAYPERLKQCIDAPMTLFSKGHLALSAMGVTQKIVALVGTRQHTAYGRAVTEEIVQGLLARGVLVVSGIAMGIDSVTHESVLAYDGVTVAVLAHGLAYIHPKKNSLLSEKIQKKGCLLTEYMSSSEPRKETFPMRNRIIAGLSDAVIVVESKEKGGSLITAHWAQEYDRDVFAVPGRLDSPTSAGCHRLIQQQRAHLFSSCEHLFEIMNWDAQPLAVSPKETAAVPVLSALCQGIYVCLQKEEKMHVDMLCQRLSAAHSQLALALLDLETLGYILRLPGDFYQLKKKD